MIGWRRQNGVSSSEADLGGKIWHRFTILYGGLLVADLTSRWTSGSSRTIDPACTAIKVTENRKSQKRCVNTASSPSLHDRPKKFERGLNGRVHWMSLDLEQLFCFTIKVVLQDFKSLEWWGLPIPSMRPEWMLKMRTLRYEKSGGLIAYIDPNTLPPRGSRYFFLIVSRSSFQPHSIQTEKMTRSWRRPSQLSPNPSKLR